MPINKIQRHPEEVLHYLFVKKSKRKLAKDYKFLGSHHTEFINIKS
jgi:hypothetical protein